MPRAEPYGQIDRRHLALDLAAAFAGIGMREIRGETQHGGDLPGLFHRAHDRIDVGRREARKEAVVVLDPLAAEGRRLVDPAPYERRRSVKSSK